MKRRGKRMILTSFLLFGITFLVIAFILAIYGQDSNKCSLPYAIDAVSSLFMVIVSPALFATGSVMYLYGRKKAQTLLSSPAPQPVSSRSNIVEKSESRKRFTTYQKLSLAVSIISVVISILLSLREVATPFTLS